MAQERSDVDTGLDPEKMAQYRCVINITWLPLMKHAMLVKKWHAKVKMTIGSCFNSIYRDEKPNNITDICFVDYFIIQTISKFNNIITLGCKQVLVFYLNINY